MFAVEVGLLHADAGEVPRPALRWMEALDLGGHRSRIEVVDDPPAPRRETGALCQRLAEKPGMPMQLRPLAGLIPNLSHKAVALGIANVKGLNPTHGWYSAGRYLRIGPTVAWLGINHQNWSRYGITPLWIVFHNSEESRAPFVLEALKAWAPPRLFEEDGRAFTPLAVLPDVARERVLD